MQEAHIDAASTLVVATELVSQKHNQKILAVLSFAPLPELFRFKIVVVSGPRDASSGAQPFYVQQVVVPPGHFADDFILGGCGDIHDPAPARPKDTIFFRNSIS